MAHITDRCLAAMVKCYGHPQCARPLVNFIRPNGEEKPMHSKNQFRNRGIHLTPPTTTGCGFWERRKGEQIVDLYGIGRLSMDYYCRECGEWACWCSAPIIGGTLCPACRVQANARATTIRSSGVCIEPQPLFQTSDIPNQHTQG